MLFVTRLTHGNYVMRIIRDLFIASAIVFSYVSFAQAVDPVLPAKAIIHGPTGGVAGDLILLDASSSTAKFYIWSVTPQLPGGRQTLVFVEGGKKAFLASVPGQYSVTLAVSNELGIDLIVYTVTISGGTPTPLPPQPVPTPIPPQPQPTPTPVPPQPQFPNEIMGMSTIANRAAAQIPASRRSSIPALALAFKSIGGAAAAGGFNSLMQIELESTTANRNAILGPQGLANPDATTIRNDFLPFFKALQPEINSRKMDKAALPVDYGRLLVEIGVGLDAVK